MGFELLTTLWITSDENEGLPGGVGSILISRISTSLHSAMSALPSALTSSNHWDECRRKPSPRLVIETLFAVALPIEIGFLAVLRGVGWLEIPFLFVGFYILFFCITVRSLSIGSSSVD